MRKIFYISLIVLVLLFGCVQTSQKLMCCDKQTALDTGECITPDGEEYETYGCDEDGEYCEVKVGEDTDGSAVKDELSFCSESEVEKCINSKCNVMICGNFNYEPIIPGIYEGETNIYTQPEQATTKGLYEGNCYFTAMDEKIQNVFDKAQTNYAYLNTFRFGFGESFKQYEEYKYYFPVSDKFCGINPDGKVDRYMNYLKPSSDVIFDPVEEIKEDYYTEGVPLPPFDTYN
ncbi:hypothetical protein JXB01_01020, partial [Candidatus Micrarchaeota archaeon]|nr:hypothetical protein [Candidatus Micrarchaeota archaeon]